jgi:PIN domain nuclease of toxin-antitoxin system
VIHLDTHVVVWLVGGEANRLSEKARSLLSVGPVRVSPMVELELSVLHEIGRITAGAAEVLAELRRSLGLEIDSASFAAGVSLAATARYSFTRDPFDRVIAAHADAAGASLLTRDRMLRAHLDFAVWD